MPGIWDERDDLVALIAEAAKWRVRRPERVDFRNMAGALAEAREYLDGGEFEEARRRLIAAASACVSSYLVHDLLSALHWKTGERAQCVMEQIFSETAVGFLSPEEENHWAEAGNAVRGFTLLSEARLRSLYVLARQVCVDDIAGNFVECGVCAGGSAALLAAVIRKYSARPRTLFAFDTFEGMPEPREVDRHEGVAANETGYGVGTLSAPEDRYLRVVCAAMNVEEIVRPVKGLFKQTLPVTRAKIGAIALLHADGDWYESTLDIFQNLYDDVGTDGIIQIDDYGFWAGCKKAVGEFQAARGVRWPLRRIDETGVWFRKEDGKRQEMRVWPAMYRNWEEAKGRGDEGEMEKYARALRQIMPGMELR